MIMGKPSTFAMDLIKRDHSIPDGSRFLMIGDNLETDIMFGNVNSIDSLLVLSGCTTKVRGNSLNAVKSELEGVPTYVQPTLNFN